MARYRTVPRCPPRSQRHGRPGGPALADYWRALSEDATTDQILSALLHMHHNRARSVDRTDEATCLRLARQVALARRARTIVAVT